MARKKKEEVSDDMNEVAEADKKQYGSSLVDEYHGELTILDNLARQVDIPDDTPASISLRDRAVMHLLAGADLHRVGNDVIEHRIKRCIGIANTVVKLLGEEA